VDLDPALVLKRVYIVRL